jgi:hypothetical protein
MRARVGRLVEPHHGAVETAALLSLYGLYELCRGIAEGSWDLAQRNAAAIVRFERELGMFWEWDVQQWATRLPVLPVLLGLAYIGLHVGGTILALVWVHRRHREHFALLRTVIVAASGLALVVYVLYPTAPPRLAGLGFVDTVTDHAGIDLNSTLLGELYNPIAAVPSLHFGYALVVGAAVAALERRRAVRALGIAYPVAMLFVIVATGNHFWLDAAAGGAVVLVAWLLARVLIAPETNLRRRRLDLLRA